MANRYLNFDKVIPDEQILEIKGRRFDLSKTPARKTTELLKVGSWASSDEIKNDQSRNYEAYIKEMESLVEVLGEDQDGKAATLDWIIDNVSMFQFNKIVDFIGSCMRGEDEVAEGEVQANFTPVAKSKQTKIKK